MQATQSNAAQTSTIDPEARLYKKAKNQQANWCDLGHVLIANHHGLAVHIRVLRTTGTAERDAAVAMLAGFPRQHQITLGTDRNSATWALVHELRALRVTPTWRNPAGGWRARSMAARPAIRAIR